MNQLAPHSVAPASQANASSPQDSRLRETFQQAVAGTFYRQMLKSLHSMHGKAAYFHGGRAEEIFQGRLDEQVAENLADRNGAAFSEDLFQRFTQQLRWQGRHAP